jgi:hypothetical protein
VYFFRALNCNRATIDFFLRSSATPSSSEFEACVLIGIELICLTLNPAPVEEQSVASTTATASSTAANTGPPDVVQQGAGKLTPKQFSIARGTRLFNYVLIHFCCNDNPRFFADHRVISKTLRRSLNRQRDQD